MRILVTGASGLIGTRLIAFLCNQGHDVTTIKWRTGKENVNAREINKITDPEKMPEAVVHLAGENIASRWTEEKMERIKESRIVGTEALCELIAKFSPRPKVLVSASAIGYYGNRGDELLNENSAKGSGFLADLCAQWEEATKIARETGIRVVNLRIGIVLSKEGGALSKMLLPFEMGAGGEIGNGQQYMSWIDIDDLVGAIYHAINNESLQGPVNAVAPYPVTNKEFTKALGAVLHRPAVMPAPPFALRLLFGPMADEMLLSGQKVLPKQLQASSYQFSYPEIEPSLKHVLFHNN